MIKTMIYKKKLLRLVLVAVGIAVFISALFVFRFTIARLFSDFLVVSYTPQPSEALIVLSGNAYDRGKYAASLIEAGVSKTIICTGANKDANALILGKDFYECELSELAVKKFCADTTISVDTLCRGTSTFEEMESLLQLSKRKGWSHITIVSSAFHTRRIRMTCNKVFKNYAIKIDIAPAPSRLYNINAWWQSEYGLIDLNNEYVKLLYYILK